MTQTASPFSGTVPVSGVVTMASRPPGTYTMPVGAFGEYQAATQTGHVAADDDGATFTLAVDGSGTIGLEPGTCEVVEEDTQAHVESEVFEDENMMPENAGTPEGDQGTSGTTGGSTSGVTALPSTGAGAADGTSLLVVAAAALSGADALSLHTRR